MSQIDRSTNLPATITSSESEAAYEQAQQLLQDEKEGYVPYDRIFSSLKQIQTAFPRITLGDLLNFLGHQFYWKRPAGEQLVLYARNQDTEGLRERGIIEICRFRVPEAWIGVGRFRIAWPEREKDQDDALFLIGLYLYSTEVSDFDRLVSDDKANAAFMATLFLDQENADLFNDLAEERFASLR